MGSKKIKIMAEVGEKYPIKRVEKIEGKPEEKKELTSGERYVLLDYTYTAKTLKVLKEHPDFPLSQLLREGRGREMPDLVTIGKLKNLGVIEIENDRIKKINLEKLPPLEKLLKVGERATKILELVNEKGVIAILQIAEILNEPYNGIQREVTKLNSLELVKEKKLPLVGRENVVFSPSFLGKIHKRKELKKEIKGMEEGNKKIEKIKELEKIDKELGGIKAMKDISERIKKIDEEIKGTKEEAQEKK